MFCEHFVSSFFKLISDEGCDLCAGRTGQLVAAVVGVFEGLNDPARASFEQPLPCMHSRELFGQPLPYQHAPCPAQAQAEKLIFRSSSITAAGAAPASRLPRQLGATSLPQLHTRLLYQGLVITMLALSAVQTLSMAALCSSGTLATKLLPACRCILQAGVAAAAVGRPQLGSQHAKTAWCSHQ